MSAEDWEVFKELRQERQQKRNDRLSSTDITGWTMITMYQYRLELVNGDKIDWYPSSNKWCLMSNKQSTWYRGAIPRALRERITQALAQA